MNCAGSVWPNSASLWLAEGLFYFVPRRLERQRLLNWGPRRRRKLAFGRYKRVWSASRAYQQYTLPVPSQFSYPSFHHGQYHLHNPLTTTRATRGPFPNSSLTLPSLKLPSLKPPSLKPPSLTPFPHTPSQTTSAIPLPQSLQTTPNEFDKLLAALEQSTDGQCRTQPPLPINPLATTENTRSKSIELELADGTLMAKERGSRRPPMMTPAAKKEG